jgi:hypothetical protein
VSVKPPAVFPPPLTLTLTLALATSSVRQIKGKSDRFC